MSILGIQAEIQKIAQTYGIKLSGINPYTNLSHLDVTNKWETVSWLISSVSMNYHHITYS